MSGMPFSEFARKRLFEPLGMKATTYVDDLRQVIKNRALAYEKQGKALAAWTCCSTTIAAAAARCSARRRDLVTWNDALASARLGTFVTEKLQEPATLNNGRKLDYARGLMLNTNYAGRVFCHGGGAAGYRSILGRFPERGMSIAVLCNAGEASDDQRRLRRPASSISSSSPTGGRPGRGADRAAERGAPIEGLDVNSKAGLFFNERTGDPLRLASQRQPRVAGGGPLLAVTKDRFRIIARRRRFHVAGRVRADVPLAGSVRAEVDGRPDDAVSPRAAVYADRRRPEGVAGRYESDELRAFFEMTPRKAGVHGAAQRPPRTRASDFQPVDRDTFMSGAMMLRFRRDQAGAITGLDLNNPAFRSVTFTQSQ